MRLGKSRRKLPEMVEQTPGGEIWGGVGGGELGEGKRDLKKVEQI